MRKIVFRVAVSIAALIAAIAAWLAWQWLPPPPKLVVSRETTWIVEPLLPDGTVDYEAAWKNERSVGVTPENNAAPFLFATLGVDSSKFTEAERAALPKDAVLYEDFDTWYYHHEKSLPESLRKGVTRPGKVVEACELGDWESPAAQLASLWLDANSACLAELERVVKRDHMVASGVFRDAGPAWMLFEVYPAFRGLAARAAAGQDVNTVFAHHSSGLRLAKLQRSLGMLAHFVAAELGEASTWESALRLARRTGRVSPSVVRDLLVAADPSNADARIRAFVASERMYGLAFLAHPFPISSPSPDAKPNFLDWLISRVDPNRACRRFNESIDQLEAAYRMGSWSERLDRVAMLNKGFIAAKARSRDGFSMLWAYRSRGAFSDVIVDHLVTKSPYYVLDMLIPSIINSERDLIELAALAFATETGRDPKSSDDLTPLLFPSPWRDRVTGAAVDFERHADGTLAARGPLIELQHRFEERMKETAPAPPH